MDLTEWAWAYNVVLYEAHLGTQLILARSARDLMQILEGFQFAVKNLSFNLQSNRILGPSF